MQSNTDEPESSILDNQEAPKFIIGVGASAGGLDALQKFFQYMPAHSGLTFVVVQHLSPDFRSLMDELLARHTEIPIHRVTSNMPVVANAIYLIPPRQNMTLDNGHLLLTKQHPEDGLNLPIDIFLFSLAAQYGGKAIGVVLSGTGSDGTKGLQAIHAAGGLTIVQEPSSAGFDGMPRRAISTGIVDVVALPQEMAQVILSYVVTGNANQAGSPENGSLENGSAENKSRLPENGSPESGMRDSDANRMLLYALLRKEFQIDFSLYKQPTMQRRIERRMSLLQQNDLSHYVMYVKQSREELDHLYRDLLIEVTSFFRDAEAFKELELHIEAIVANCTQIDGVRVWVPGCATGEEAYSIAILFACTMQALDKSIPIQIFATDAHEDSLHVAAKGIYSAEAVESVPAGLLNEFFENYGPKYRIKNSIRQMVIFAPHNVLLDPPFTRLDLISCRNLLIYLQPAAQQKTLRRFQSSLRLYGILFLGSSEHLGTLESDFEPVDDRWRIYRKHIDSKTSLDSGIVQNPTLNRIIHTSRVERATLSLKSGLYEQLLADFVPSGYLLNHDYDLLHVFGDANKYLLLSGNASLNIFELVNGDLETALRAGLFRASKQQEKFVLTGIEVSENAALEFVVNSTESNAEMAESDMGSNNGKPHSHHVQLTFTPIKSQKQTTFHYLIQIVLMNEPDSETLQNALNAVAQAKEHEFTLDADESEHISLLESELGRTREHLQSAVEELETTNEELQSTNEELIASNEELQSTNEELQSVNEELFTVNAEHQQKINELQKTNNDMANLQQSTGIGTIFLDKQFAIRSFTTAVTTIIGLLPQDIGRAIDTLYIDIGITPIELRQMFSDVLESKRMQEHEVKTRQEQNYLLRILPYTSEFGAVEGVVMTFTDITLLRSTQRELLAQTDELEQKNLLLTHRSADLERFIHIASHDLKEPVRGLQNYVGILQKQLLSAGVDAAEAGRDTKEMGVPEKGSTTSISDKKALVETADTLLRLTDRMQNLVDDLRTFSRISQNEGSVHVIDPNQLIERCLARLEPLITALNGHVQIVQKLPAVEFVPADLQLVFEHLITNGLKFNDSEHRTIFIGVTTNYINQPTGEHRNSPNAQNSDELIFYVQDNGIGIPPKHHDKVFDMFRRLHVQEAYGGGTGAGLAIVKKILDNQGGRIWFETDVGEGTTFYFTTGLA